MSIAPALATMHATEKFRGNDTVGHIVVVNDDPATRRIVTSYFRDHDMPASSASGRQELIRHLASGAPTLIILDLRLGRDGRWQLERESRRLTTQDGSLVALTKSELSLLVAFLQCPQRPLTREQLLQATRVHEDVFDRGIDVQVLRLRRKLETDASSPRIIRTERGVGYVFELPVETF